MYLKDAVSCCIAPSLPKGEFSRLASVLPGSSLCEAVPRRLGSPVRALGQDEVKS